MPQERLINVSCGELCARNVNCGAYVEQTMHSCYLCDPSTYNPSQCSSLITSGIMAADKPCNANGECLICSSTKNVAGMLRKIKTATLYVSKTCVYLQPGGAIGTAMDFDNMRSVSIIGPGTITSSVATSVPTTIQNIFIDFPHSNAAVTATGSYISAHNLRTNADVGIIVKNTDADITVTNCTAKLFVLAVAHSSGSVQITCTSPCTAIIQELTAKNIKFTGNENLHLINLTDMLNVYGNDYEIEYFNGAGHSSHYLVPYINTVATVLGLLVASSLVVYDEFMTIVYLKYSNAD